MSDGDGKTTERWVYAGVRVLTNGKRACTWIDPSGRTLRYAERNADAVIGARYEATVTREDGQSSLWGQPRFIEKPDHDDPKVAEWATADRIAKIRLARAQMERSAAKIDALEAALAPIEELAASYRTQADLDALVAYVSRRIHNAYFNRAKR